jgi:hypothetical protein
MPNPFIIILAIIVCLLTGVFIATKKMCENIDNVDEDDKGVFRDKRDVV